MTGFSLGSSGTVRIRQTPVCVAPELRFACGAKIVTKPVALSVPGKGSSLGIVVAGEAEAMMGKPKGVASHHEREVAELGADRELAVEYLKAAMESLDNPNDRAAGLLALRTVAEAYGGPWRGGRRGWYQP